MKVLLSAYACRPNTGSEPGIGWNWAIHLAKAGCEVHLLTAVEHKSVLDAYLQENPCDQLHPHYVPMRWLRLSVCGERIYYFFWQWASFYAAISLARTIRFDVAHHVSYGAGQLPTQLWRLGLPTIFGPVGGGNTTPEVLLPYLGRGQGIERLRTFLIHKLPKVGLYKSWMRRMSAVLAANRDTKLIAQQVGCGRVELLCDTGIRDDFRSNNPRIFQEAPTLRVLWVGRLLPRKGLALALDALAQADPNIHLTLVGDGMPQKQVRAMISARSLQDRVDWEGVRLPWIRVREAYESHDALLFTSLRDSFGSQNLEAMSVGLPVITLKLSGARDFIPDDASLKVNVGSTKEETIRNLASALDDYASFSIERRNRMSEAAWRGAQAFGWTSRALFAMRLYEDLVGDGRSPQRSP